MITRSLIRQNRSFSFLLLSAATSALLYAGSAQATFVQGSTIQFNDNEGGSAFRVLSLYAGNSFVSGYAFDGVTPVSMSLGVVDEYHLFSAASNTVTSVLSDGTRISLATTPDTAINTFVGIEQVYTASDPTGGVPDLVNLASVNALNDTIDGTIDIAGLTSGTLYFIYGSQSADSRLTSFTVANGGSSLTFAESGTGFWLNADTTFAVTAIAFTNDAGSDTISYSYDQSGAGKLVGVILSDTVVPEPASLAMVTLSGLLILRRRRGN